jgi:Sortase domain
VARRRRRSLVPLAAAAALAGVFCTGLGLGQAASGVRLPGWAWAREEAPPREFPVLEPSRPVRIAIPSIGVRAPVHEVGLAEDGSIAVPNIARRNEAGWYRAGPTPGQVGPAVIVGHVDTRTGPAVFYDLSRVRPGARIEVTRQDRRVAIFRVNSVEAFSKARLPADRVYGDFTRPGLRLITCGGQWVGGELGYADNVIVFASLVSSHRA